MTPLGLARWQARTRFDILFVDNKAVVCKISVSSFQHSLLKVWTFYVALLVSRFLPFACRWITSELLSVCLQSEFVLCLQSELSLHWRAYWTVRLFFNNVVWLIPIGNDKQLSETQTHFLTFSLDGRGGGRGGTELSPHKLADNKVKILPVPDEATNPFKPAPPRSVWTESWSSPVWQNDNFAISQVNKSLLPL